MTDKKFLDQDGLKQVYKRIREDIKDNASSDDIQEKLDAKVDKEKGKGLSTKDFTAEAREILNYSVFGYDHIKTMAKELGSATYKANYDGDFNLFDPSLYTDVSTGEAGYHPVTDAHGFRITHATGDIADNSSSDTWDSNPTSVAFVDNLARMEFVLNGPDNPWLKGYKLLTETSSGWGVLLQVFDLNEAARNRYREYSSISMKISAEYGMGYAADCATLGWLGKIVVPKVKQEAFIKVADGEVSESTDLTTKAYYRQITPSSSSYAHADNVETTYQRETDYFTNTQYYKKDTSLLTLENIDLSKCILDAWKSNCLALSRCGSSISEFFTDFSTGYHIGCNWVGQRLLALLKNSVNIKLAIGDRSFGRDPSDWVSTEVSNADDLYLLSQASSTATTYLTCSRYSVVSFPNTLEHEAKYDYVNKKITTIDNVSYSSNNYLVMYFDYKPSELMIPLYGLNEPWLRAKGNTPNEDTDFQGFLTQSLGVADEPMKTMAVYIRLYNDQSSSS